MESEEQRSLWIGEVDQTLNEAIIANAFPPGSELVGVKIIRDKATGLNAGYGFVEFSSRAAAVRAMETLNGKAMPGTISKTFRFKYASRSSSVPSAISAISSLLSQTTPTTTTNTLQQQAQSIPTGEPFDYGVYVSSLDTSVSEYQLLAAFAARGYSSIRNAKIVIDPLTNMSKGYGFVRFGDENDRNRALTEMSGAVIGSKTIRTGLAQGKKTLSTDGTTIAQLAIYQKQQQQQQSGGSASGNSLESTLSALGLPQIASANANLADESNNTTIYVGSLDQSVNEEQLRSAFIPYGDITSVKILPGKGCGFVSFNYRVCAESAFAMNGQPIGNSRVRVSWGKGQNPIPNMQQPPNAFAVIGQQFQQQFGQQFQQQIGQQFSPNDLAMMQQFAILQQQQQLFQGHQVQGQPIQATNGIPKPIQQILNLDDLSKPVPVEQMNSSFVTDERIKVVIGQTSIMSRAEWGIQPLCPLLSK